MDIDHSIREDGSLNDVANSVLSIFKSAYVEKSPSGTGLRGFFRIEPDYVFDKVDRSAAYMARKIARDVVLAGYVDKCEIQLSYAIGIAEPVGIAINCSGTEIQPLDFIQAYVKDSYDLTPRGIIKSPHLLDVDYNTISAYGYFTNPDMPWEQ